MPSIIKIQLPYKPGTPLEAIVEDGWSRDFRIEQTVDEARAMGYDVTEDYVRSKWTELQSNFDAWAESCETGLIEP